MLRRKCILLLLTLLLGLARNSLGFAAWLKCNRRLEEDDFIMNNKVRKAQDDEPVRLAVYDESGSRVDVSSTDISGESIVWIDSSDASSSKLYQIRMDAASIEGLSDIQYVVETSPFDGISYIPPEEDPSLSQHRRVLLLQRRSRLSSFRLRCHPLQAVHSLAHLLAEESFVMDSVLTLEGRLHM